MAKYTSGRQRNLKVGISSYSENTQVVSVIGRVGIGSTVFNADYDLDVRGTVKFSGDIILGNSSSNLINVPGRISSNFYPDGDGTYDVGRGPQIGSGANRWKDANFLGIGKFDGGVDAHNLELGVSSANLIYSTSGNLELNSQSGTTNIDDILTISGNTGIGTVNPQQKLWVEGNGYFSGILTAQRLYSSLYGEFVGGSISGTNIVGTALSITGISTFTNGPVFIGAATSTGTASQPLQVTGGAYVSGNLGIGVTNPITELTINGRISAGNSISSQSIGNVIDQNVGTGYSAARSFNLVDTSSVIKIVRNNDSFGPIVEFQHWNVGITSLISYWDINSEQGTFSIRDRIGNYDQTKQQLTRIFINEYGNVLLGASNQAIGPNKIQSVGYGTANILQVNGGAYVSGSVGIGTTNPTSKLWVDGGGYFTGVVTATTFIGNLSGTATTATNLSNAANITTGTIDKDRLLNSNSFSVLGDLYVSNNISFGGTTTQLNLQQLQIVDADIVLGIGTSFSPTDNTANHGGIAIASTEGTPLVDLNIIPQETNPSTYKKIMWFKGDTIGAGLTDAWLFNYAVGIGTTQVPNGVRLAVGGLKVTDTTISTPNLNVSGISTLGVTTATNLTSQQLNVSGLTTSNAYYIGTSQVISSSRELQNIASLDATTTATIETAIQQAPNDFTSLNISGISTLQSTTLIGGGTSTGTAGQVLQVTGGAYVSGSVGIGTTNPQTALDVRGAITVGVGTVGINSIFSTTNIQSWSYTNKSKTPGDDTTPQAIYVGASGTAMFMVGDTGNDINQYTLSTPYDVSTAGASVGVFSVATQETVPTGIDFNPTGTKMFISGSTGVAPLSGDYVHEYSLSTAWTVSSAGYTTSFNITQDTTPQGVAFGNSGSKMYVVGSTNDTVYQYSLSTPYSIASGVTYDSKTLVLGTDPVLLETAPTDISFNSTGTVLWIVGSTNDRIYEFRLGTAWDISTAVFYDDVYIGFNEITVTGLHVIPEQNVAYIVGSGSDTVFQYSTNTPAIKIASSGISSVSSIVLNNETRVKDNLYVKGLAHFDNNILTQSDLTVNSSATVAGTLTGTGALALSGATGSNIVLGTNQTTATLIIGGASQTGTITLGQATVSQTTNIQAGASGVGTTKTINLGTGGASGSFTQINIGPTAGVGTVVINSGTNLGIGTTTPTSTLTVAGNVLVSGISTLGITTTTNLTAQQLNISGITTVGFLTATNISVSGIVTSNAYYIGTTQVISSTRELQNIASLDATTTATIESAIQNAPNTFTDLNVTGISTLGVTSATNLTAQQLNVSGVSTISVNSSSDALRITQTGSGNALVVEDSANPDASPFVIKGGGYGWVGIGTTNPLTELHLQSVDPTLMFLESDASANNQRWINSVNGEEFYWQAINDSGSGGGNIFKMTRSGNQIQTFEGRKNANTWFIVNNNTQTVGIGTTNPQVKLDISGDIRVSSGSTFVFGTGLGVGQTAPGYTYALSNPFTSVQIGGTANRRGNALVDITAANYPDATNVLNVQTTSETYTGTIGTYKPYTPAGTVIEIGNTRASQRVGIGSTLFGRSAALISIYAYNNDNVTNAFFGAVAGDVQNGPSNFVFGRRTGAFSWEETVRIDTSGNLGIGTTNPTSKLHVVGDTYISGILTATDINSASDIRLKTNIKPFENTLEKIVHINGVSFNWIDGNAKSGGIIAQDVEKVFPELVNDGDHKTVNYNGLIGVLVESIKELKQEIEDLKSRLGEI